MTPLVALLDYGAGNLHSLAKALELGGATARVTSDWDVALAGGLPCLGICLGMQLFFDGSDVGEGEGIGLIPGSVRRLDTPVVPHMGWNDVGAAADPLFAGLDEGLPAYYAHSYRCDPEDEGAVIGWTDYSGERIAAAVRMGRTWGVQFHPEKSSRPGLRLIANFLEEARR